jgi:hypothetical protein
MSIGDGEDWSRIVEGFLLALFDKTRSMVSARTSMDSFMENFATPGVYADYVHATKERLESLLPPPGEDVWKIVADDYDRIVVDIPVDLAKQDGTPVPMCSTRLVIKRQLGEWRLSDAFEQCISCNLDSDEERAGICRFCDGTAECYGEIRRFHWVRLLFRKPILEKKKCDFCNGTGKCKWRVSRMGSIACFAQPNGQ